MPGRIKKKILVGEGPNGEDVELTIDTLDNDREIDRRYLSEDEVASRSVLEAKPTKEPAKRLLSADELVERALRQEEEDLSSKVDDLAESVIEACAKVALDGKLSYALKDTSPKLVKALVARLRELKYTVSKPADPVDGVWKLEIKWKTSRPRKGKKTKALPSLENEGLEVITFKPKTE